MQLVGNRQGKRVVRWGRVALSFLLYTAIAAVAAAGVYMVLVKYWNPVILIVGPAVGFIATISSLIISLRTPIHELPILTWYPK
ncbi:MAG: hypothetical protein IPK15_00170 [Verrucomicrobia bacterium]|jgi:hypothetical protein|nr:hypothetical protein [Verrucomicrobiota bacterium]